MKLKITKTSPVAGLQLALSQSIIAGDTTHTSTQVILEGNKMI